MIAESLTAAGLSSANHDEGMCLACRDSRHQASVADSSEAVSSLYGSLNSGWRLTGCSILQPTIDWLYHCLFVQVKLLAWIAIFVTMASVVHLKTDTTDYKQVMMSLM